MSFSVSEGVNSDNERSRTCSIVHPGVKPAKKKTENGVIKKALVFTSAF